MGVSYRACFGVGKEFEEQCEVREWLAARGFECTDEQIDYYGFEEAFEFLPDGVTIECTNLYTGYGYIVYIPVSVWEVEKIGERVNNAIDVWTTSFNEHPETIHTVKVC